MPPSDGVSGAGGGVMTPAGGGSSRGTPVWLLALAGLLLVARIGVGVWDANNPESRSELVNWAAPSAANETARDRGRLVLYAFTDRKDPASRKMASDLFADPAIAQQLGRLFVPVRIEGNPAADTPETAALRGRFHVTTLPALVVATPDGARSKLLPGFRNARATMEALTAAQMELVDLPFTRRGGFQFKIGGNRGGAGDSSGAGGDSVRTIE